VNTLPYYLLLLLAMSHFLFAGTCFFAAAGFSRKVFVPFLLYSVLLGLSFLSGLIGELPGFEIIFGNLRFPFQILAFFFLAESTLTYFEISRKIRFVSYFTVALLMLLPLYLMKDLGKGEIFALYMISVPILPLSSVMLWRMSNRYVKFEAPFKIASVFHFGNGIAILTGYLFIYHTLPEKLAIEKEGSMILLCFSLLCTLICVASFLMLLDKRDFPSRRAKYSAFILIPGAFLVFAVAGAVIPEIFWIYGDRIASFRVRSSADLLLRDLEGISVKMRIFVRELSEKKEIIELLEKDRINRSAPDVSNILEYKFTARSRTIVYLLNRNGLCIDSSNKSNPHLNLTGQDISFAKYFELAMRNGSATTMAVGAVSGLPSVFTASRVVNRDGVHLGVVASRTDISSVLDKFVNSYAALISPENTVLFTNTARIDTRDVKWEIGSRWTCPAGELYREHYQNGIFFIELPCTFLSVPGWRLILGKPTAMPLFFYTLGQIFLLFVWILALCSLFIYILQMKIRTQLIVHNLWRDAVFNNNTSGIVVVDMNRSVIDCNETMTRMLGYTLPELQKLGFQTVYPNGSTGRAFLETVSRIFEEGKTYENPAIQLRRKNGTLSIFKIAGCCFKIDSTLPVDLPRRGIVWTVTDQTHELKETARLKEREEMFRSIVESSSEHIFLLDSHGFFLYSNNRRISAMLKDMGSLHLRDVYDPQTAALYQNMVENVLTSGTPLSFQHVMKTPGGKSQMTDVLCPVRRDGIIYAAAGISRMQNPV